MSDRVAVTEQLSRLVERRLNARRMYWSAEVDFDLGTPASRRIDYVGFKPFTPNYVTESASVELGTFECYEVKSCMEDFNSGHGLTFYGDRNFLVTTRVFAMELRDKGLIPTGVDEVLVPDKPMRRLITLWQHDSGQSYRRRPASEMLWQIVTAHTHSFRTFHDEEK